MGRFDQIDFNGRNAGVRMCEDVLIVASPHYADGIDWTSDPSIFPGISILGCHETDPIPVDAINNCSLVVLEIDPASRKSMDRLAAIKEVRPDLAVIAAIPNASVALVRTLVRQGVLDVVSLPFVFEEVFEAAVSTLSQESQETHKPVVLAPLIAVAQSISGCGATSIATHLAAELGRASSSGRGVAIVDLDLQFGAIADFMSAEGKGSIQDLLDAAERLDEELLRSISRQVDSNVSVFAAPEAIPPLESVDIDQLLKVLAILRRTYDYVIIDLPSNWTNWTLSALSAADAILMVTELSLNSLRQAKRRLELFDNVGIDRSRTLVVVNRMQRRLFKTIDVDDIHATLAREVIGNVALDDPTVSSAQQQGLLVNAIQRKSRFFTDVQKITDSIAHRWPTGSGR
ncbi:MAG: CpaE family protein [Novosphingobium sp.]